MKLARLVPALLILGCSSQALLGPALKNNPSVKTNLRAIPVEDQPAPVDMGHNPNVGITVQALSAQADVAAVVHNFAGPSCSILSTQASTVADAKAKYGLVEHDDLGTDKVYVVSVNGPFSGALSLKPPGATMPPVYKTGTLVVRAKDGVVLCALLQK